MTFIDLIGTPFVGLGRDPKKGLDCYGLTMEVFRRYGYEIPEYTEDTWEDTDKTNDFYKDTVVNSNKYWEEVKDLETLQPPILIAFTYGNVKFGIVNHSGVYIGNGRFIHTRQKVGCCIERIDGFAWRRLIVGLYRFKGVKNDNFNNSEKPC